MLLRTIIGADMPDGMRRVREQLGEDAIIVQVEEIEGGGVMLLAAADGDVPVRMPPAAPRPAAKPEARPDARPDAKPETRVEARAEARSEGRPDPRPAPAAMPAERLLDRIAEALSFHRVSPQIAERLIDAVESGVWTDPADALAAALAATLGFSAEPPPAMAAPILLVGSAGCG